MTRTTADREVPVVWRHVIDGVAMVELVAFRKLPTWELRALPRPAPPQEEPHPWWHWRRWR